MATRTQVGFELAQGCVHEQICEAVYAQQRRRIQVLCQWMVPEPAAARQLALAVFLAAWGGPGATSWPAVSGDQLIESFAARFRNLFHPDPAAAPAGPAANGATGPWLVLSRDNGQTVPGAGVRAAVAALPQPQRLLYLLHELEGCSPCTLARWLDLEPAACAAMIHQARLQLRRSLRAA